MTITDPAVLVARTPAAGGVTTSKSTEHPVSTPSEGQSVSSRTRPAVAAVVTSGAKKANPLVMRAVRASSGPASTAMLPDPVATDTSVMGAGTENTSVTSVRATVRMSRYATPAATTMSTIR